MAELVGGIKNFGQVFYNEVAGDGVMTELVTGDDVVRGANWWGAGSCDDGT